MTDDKTPATEAGRRDHEDAWSAVDDWSGNHLAQREGCPGCAKIAAIEAEAREQERDRMDTEEYLPRFEEAFRKGQAQARTEALDYHVVILEELGYNLAAEALRGRAQAREQEREALRPVWHAASYESGRADAANAIALASIPRSVANGGAQAVRRYLLAILTEQKR